MRQSELFSKTTKTAPKAEVSLNAQLLIRAGFVDKLYAGVYSLLPLGWRTVKKIENIIREAMQEVDGQEVFLPTLHPKKNWVKTGRINEYDVLFKTKIGEDKEFVMGPTHEEVISPLARKFISSYKDLPQVLYQFQNKFRAEKRAKSGVLRGREFIMKDLYSFHADKKDLDQYYEKVQAVYHKIFERCGLGDKTLLTYASGGTFAKYSHEFQTLTEAGEDLIHVCEKCRVAVNQEIIEDQKHKCPQCGSDQLKPEKAAEVGNIFKLGTRFSEPFDLNYLDQKGKSHLVVMGCYGIGLQRLMGVIAETSNDEHGLIWPAAIAPFQVHLIALAGAEAEAEKLYQTLQKNQIEVLFDDRADKKPGEKFADADLIGLPVRVVVSPKTVEAGKYEVKKRTEQEAKMLSEQELIKYINVR